MWGGFRSANAELLLDNGCNFDILNCLETQRAEPKPHAKIMGRNCHLKGKNIFPLKFECFLTLHHVRDVVS